MEKWSITKTRAYESCKRYFAAKYIQKLPPENPEPSFFQAGRDFHLLVQSIMMGEEENVLNIPEKFIGLNWRFEERIEGDILEGLLIVGVLDAIVELSSEHVAIAEFKSYPASKEEILTQLGVYATILSLEWQKKPPMVTFLSITPARTLEQVFEPDEYVSYGARFIRKVESIIKEIEEHPEQLGKPNPGGACLSCQWRRSCPAMQSNHDLEAFTQNPELLAQKLLQLELELQELKEIARAFVEAGAKVQTGDICWDYQLVEELEVDPLQVYNYLIEKNINPFFVPIGRTSKPILKVDSRVLKDFARKVDPDISNLVEIKVSKRFGRKRVDEE